MRAYEELLLIDTDSFREKIEAQLQCVLAHLLVLSLKSFVHCIIHLQKKRLSKPEFDAVSCVTIAKQHTSKFYFLDIILRKKSWEVSRGMWANLYDCPLNFQTASENCSMHVCLKVSHSKVTSRQTFLAVLPVNC